MANEEDKNKLVKITYKGEPIQSGIGMLNFDQPEVGKTYEVKLGIWETHDQEGWKLSGGSKKKSVKKKTPPPIND